MVGIMLIKKDMSRVTPVLLYSLTGAVVLSSLSSCKEKKSEEVKKTMNVVYIMCDDHSYQTISAYDQRYMQTPNIDRIASEGVTTCFPYRQVLTGMNVSMVSLFIL